MPPGDVTQLLRELRAGRPDAMEQLVPLVYEELHALAARYLRAERRDHTLQPTALVHEAFLRLVDQREGSWQNRAHFFAIAARAMRRILVDHARRRAADKRGGGAAPVTLNEGDDVAAPDAEPLDVIMVDDALGRLAALDERQARVVELRYFAGLDIDETAEALGVSPATVKRDWLLARAFLQRELGPR